MALSVWRLANGWREVFARIFDGFDVKLNTTPNWLVNPTTNRRLKLNMLYPEIGIAVRFEGMQGQQSRRLSLEEEDQQRVRFDARVEVCRQHNIHLVVADLATGKSKQVFQQADTALSRAAETAPADLKPRLKAARVIAGDLAAKIRHEDNLALYADLWSDRQYQLSEPLDDPSSPSSPIDFTPGMEVEHTHFGPGVIVSSQSNGDDTLLTVDFITAGQKILAASLVAGKLLPRKFD